MNKPFTQHRIGEYKDLTEVRDMLGYVGDEVKSLDKSVSALGDKIDTFTVAADKSSKIMAYLTFALVFASFAAIPEIRQWVISLFTH